MAVSLPARISIFNTVRSEGLCYSFFVFRAGARYCCLFN